MTARRPPMVEVDPAHGGRCTSLRAPGGREWLWRRHAPERDHVRPGDPFVDAGGLEECLPTVDGLPDHGDAWSRPWYQDGDGLAVEGDGYRLRRVIETTETEVIARYELRALPGWRFLWATHALLDVSTSATLDAPDGHPTVVRTPDGPVAASWPRPLGIDAARLGPSDGSAHKLLLPGLDQITVSDRGDRLTLVIGADQQPVSIAIWRNLGGWPPDGPYRSIGVEPMLGHADDLGRAEPGQCAVVPASGRTEWELRLRFSSPEDDR